MSTNNKIKNKSVPVWVALILILLLAGTVSFALVETVLPAQHISIFNSQVEPSNFAVMSSSVKVQGPDRLSVSLVLKNMGNSPHSANVTVILLDSSGNQIMNMTMNTGSISQSATTPMMRYTFSGQGIVSEFNNYMVIVNDTA